MLGANSSFIDCVDSWYLNFKMETRAEWRVFQSPLLAMPQA